MRLFNYLMLGALAVAAGIGLPLQAAVNVRLRELARDPVRASFLSFLIGTALLLGLSLATREPLPSIGEVARAPWWIWLGGIFGAFYIVSSIVVVPRLGAAFTFALVVGGQMLASMIVDRFGLFGLTQTPLTTTRVAGAALLVGGVLLIRK